MLSRRADNSALSGSHNIPYDPAAMLCAFLMARRGWCRSRIALTLGVPTLVLEECIRNGVSSAALRSQLALWITENKDDSLPSSLVNAVLLDARTLSPSSVGAPESFQDNDLFLTLDPVTQSHFAELESSVGQSFISILNDPQEVQETTSNWGSWFGSARSSALEQRGQIKHAECAMNLRSSSPLLSSPSSEILLSRYGLQEDYSSYLQLVTAPYNRNREEGRLAAVSTDTNTRRNTAGASLLEEKPPWPAGIPKKFFDSSYDANSVIQLLERKLRERVEKDATEEEEGSKHVALKTFGEDFEVMEAQMKELRQWECVVEECLLQHVQSRSEHFFEISQEFGLQAAEARETLEDLQQARRDIRAFGKGLVHEMLMSAKCYRNRNNLGALCTLAEMVMMVSSQMIAIENWVSLPERDMIELPVIVDIFCSLQDAILVENDNEKVSTNVGALGTGWITKVTALKGIPRRVLHVKERLYLMISEQLEFILLPTAAQGSVDEGHINRSFLSAVKMGIWPSVVAHCRNLLVDSLWMTVREAFIAFIMNHCEINDSTVNNLLSTAVTADSSREEKLKLFTHSNACRFAMYIQLITLVSDKILDFVSQAAQRWSLLVVEIVPDSSSPSTDWLNVEGTKKYFSVLCAAAEGILALLLEVRSHHGKTPANIRDLETLISLGCIFLPNLVSNLQGVLAVCGSIGDPWDFVSGKRIKSAVTRLAKEHLRLHHVETIEKLRVTIESETWQPEDIDPAFQSSLDNLCQSDDAAVERFRSCAVFTERVGDSIVRHPAPTPERKTTAATATAVVVSLSSSAPKNSNRSATATTADTKKSLLLPLANGRSESRVVSRSLLLLIELLQEYDDYLGRFPFLAFDVMGKIYDFLRLYDSQCAALLLGAMAVENGVLKTITTQHMAVASQNLAFLYDCIPVMQKRWLRATTVDKLSPSIVEDLERVRKDCAMYRYELFGKISDLVRDKVGVLGTVTAENWRESGNEWVMTMLRETAKLLRVLKPLLPVEDCRGVVVPLLGTFARMIRSVTMSPAVDADIRVVMLSDVLLFKANVERFGFDVLRCAMLSNSVAEAMVATVEPSASEADVVAWFLQ